MEFENKNKIIDKLTEFLGALIVGLPVVTGFSVILILGLTILFFLLVISTILTSSPIIFYLSGESKVLIQGIPQISLFFFGLGFMCATVVLFIAYINLVKGVYSVIENMKRELKKGGKNAKQ